MLRNALLSGLVAIGLSGCAVTPVSAPEPVDETGSADAGLESSSAAAQIFLEVVRIVEPVAERECRSRTSGVNCNFRIVVDDRPGMPANAFQTVDRSGQPIIAFTVKLLKDARNRDELAFVLGHEAAHHIEGHIDRTQQNAVAGAVIAGSLAVLLGSNPEAVEIAQQRGAHVGARTYSKEFELEADALGTIIAARAGFDPVRGSEFFTRIPDPGDRFLGSHPPNAQRVATVKRVAAGL